MVGLQWQYTRGSALIGFVKEDAAFIAQRIADREAAESIPQEKETDDGPEHVHEARL